MLEESLEKDFIMGISHNFSSVNSSFHKMEKSGLLICSSKGICTKIRYSYPLVNCISYQAAQWLVRNQEFASLSNYEISQDQKLFSG